MMPMPNAAFSKASDHRPQRQLLLLAAAEVDDRCQHRPTGIRLDGAQPDLDRKFAAILAQPVELAAGAHLARSRTGVEARMQGAMGPAEAFGHQHLDRPAE